MLVVSSYNGKKRKWERGRLVIISPLLQRVNPEFCVTAKLWCKIEQKCFKAGAAQAAAAFSTKITALRGDVKGGGVSLRSSRLLTFRLQPVSPACGRQRTFLSIIRRYDRQKYQALFNAYHSPEPNRQLRSWEYLLPVIRPAPTQTA